MRRLLGAVLVGVLAAALPEPSGASRCASQKISASGVYVRALSRCAARAVRKGEAPDVLCLARAEQKLFARIEKAERKADCPTLGDAIPLQDVLDDGAGDARDAVETATTSVCCETPGYCVYAADAASCTTQVGGTPGAPGTLCEASGACVAPPATAGNCCDELPVLSCAASPLFDAATCDLQGGVFTGASLCDPTGQCLPPGGLPESRCTAKKHQALGSYGRRLARCGARAAKQGTTVEAVCAASAESKLGKAWARAEKRDDCIAEGEAGEARGALADALLLAFSILGPDPAICCQGVGVCAWLPDADVCTGVGGTPGSAGSVCDAATGSCAPPPGGEGSCCEGSLLGGMSTCEAGPNVDDVSCAANGGSLVPDAACVSAGLCID